MTDPNQEMISFWVVFCIAASLNLGDCENMIDELMAFKNCSEEFQLFLSRYHHFWPHVDVSEPEERSNYSLH